jgi:hypothetical protein
MFRICAIVADVNCIEDSTQATMTFIFLSREIDRNNEE